MALATPLGAASDPNQQQITPLPVPAEQRVQVMNPAGEQQVQALNIDGEQQVNPGTTSPAGRVARGIGKVAVGVLAGAVSIGVMVASLLLI